jgi:hypothetical protein
MKEDDRVAQDRGIFTQLPRRVVFSKPYIHDPA